MTNDDKKMPKNAEKFICIFCDFKCIKKSNYTNHLLTLKHQRMTNDDKKMPKNAENLTCDCGKSFSYRQGLWKHKTRCNYVATTDTDLTYNSNINETATIDYLKSENAEFKKMLLEMMKSERSGNTIITNNNKTFNLNLFLNEQCKDAMNLMEFVDSLHIKLSDLENVGKLGFVTGISNIIVENLKALDIHKRPVHCSDSKREIMYIKDEDKWGKDNQEKNKLRKAIKHIAHKNSKMIPEFKAKYPDCVHSNSQKSDQYNKLIIEAMGGIGDDAQNETKIIKKIAREVIISKE
jgi:hypothetical protein